MANTFHHEPHDFRKIPECKEDEVMCWCGTFKRVENSLADVVE